MPKVAVVGGGFAGCAASISAAKAGADVTLLERTDLLLGNGLGGGFMNFNGRFTAAEEAKKMGGGDLFEALESIILYRDANIPGTENGYIYHVGLSEPIVKRLLEKFDVSLKLQSLAVNVEKKKDRIISVALSDSTVIEADSFIDCTGSAGGVPICTKYGRGCVMCLLRCPSFGDRVSIATKAGAPELMRRRTDSTPGAVSSAVNLFKETLSQKFRSLLEKKGIVMIPLPREFVEYKKLTDKTAAQYSQKEHVENLILVNIGYVAKCNGLVYFPLEWMRKLEGFENARFENPLAGGKFNSIRFISMAPRDNSLRVNGFANLFCAGEKSGPNVGLTEALVTGALAGHNAVRIATKREPLVLPRATAIGDFIAYIGEQMTEEGLKTGYSFAGGPYFKRMVEQGLYTTSVKEIEKRIEKEGLTNIFTEKLT